VATLTAANKRIAALARAVLVLEYPLPVPTLAVAERVSRRYDPAVYRMLRRMEARDEAERIRLPGAQSVYWRLVPPCGVQRIAKRKTR
jgi:hypothetical protein